MKQVKGFWLPDHEEHLVSYIEKGAMFRGGPTYQMHKWSRALTLFQGRRHFVDVGAHCGLWTRPMATMFARVTAFEPHPEHRECWTANMAQYKPPGLTRLEPFALGAEAGVCRIRSKPGSSGDCHIDEAGEIEATIARLDDFDLRDVDFLKIDCEGYELPVIIGGEATIRRDRPCIVVEQKPQHRGRAGIVGDPAPAVTLLKSWGAKLAFELGGDFCLTW